MITGVWISPDRSQMAVQFDEDSFAAVDARFEQLLDLDEILPDGQIPRQWEPLFDPEQGTGDARDRRPYVCRKGCGQEFYTATARDVHEGACNGGGE